MEHLFDVVRDVVAQSLTGLDQLLKLVGSTGVVAVQQQTGQFKPVAATELLLPLVLDGCTIKGCLLPRVVGQLGQFGIEIAVATALEQLAIDVGGFLAFTHNSIDHAI